MAAIKPGLHVARAAPPRQAVIVDAQGEGIAARPKVEIAGRHDIGVPVQTRGPASSLRPPALPTHPRASVRSTSIPGKSGWARSSSMSISQRSTSSPRRGQSLTAPPLGCRFIGRAVDRGDADQIGQVAHDLGIVDGARTRASTSLIALMRRLSQSR